MMHRNLTKSQLIFASPNTKYNSKIFCKKKNVKMQAIFAKRNNKTKLLQPFDEYKMHFNAKRKNKIFIS